MRIDAVRLGLAGGFIESFLLFVLTLIAMTNGYGTEILSLLNDLPGFEVTMIGSLVGAGYGFILGFIKLFALAFIYNLLGSEKE